MGIRILFTILTTVVGITWSINAGAQPTKGSAAAHFNDKNYEVAKRQYIKLIRKAKDDPEINEKLGLTYLYTDDDKTLAIPHLEFVDTLEKTEKFIHMELGKAYFYDNDFPKATKYINEFLNNVDDHELPERIQEAKDFLRYIENAKELMKSPKNVTFINMAEEINSKENEYYPFVTLDDNLMLFSSNRKYIADFEMLVKNTYMSKPWRGSWTKAKSLGSKINSEEDEMIVDLDYYGKYVLIYANTLDAENDIMISREYRGRFKEPESFGANVNTPLIEMGGCLSENEDTLYFASERDGGFGGLDLYYSLKLPSGEFGIPVNLGDKINTPYDENFPKLQPGGRELFFASKGHNSMGGYDIFSTQMNLKDKSWNPPVNYGYPVNNAYDNEIISFIKDKKYGYVSMYRKDALGYRDIYKIVAADAEVENVVYTGRIAVGDSLHEKQLSDINQEIVIKVFVEGSKDVYGLYSINKKTSRYAIALPPGRFELVITGEGYDEYRQVFEVYDRYYEEKIFMNNIWLNEEGAAPNRYQNQRRW